MVRLASFVGVLWMVRVVRIIMEVNWSLGNLVWCGVVLAHSCAIFLFYVGGEI